MPPLTLYISLCAFVSRLYFYTHSMRPIYVSLSLSQMSDYRIQLKHILLGILPTDVLCVLYTYLLHEVTVEDGRLLDCQTREVLALCGQPPLWSPPCTVAVAGTVDTFRARVMCVYMHLHAQPTLSIGAYCMLSGALQLWVNVTSAVCNRGDRVLAAWCHVTHTLVVTVANTILLFDHKLLQVKCKQDLCFVGHAPYQSIRAEPDAPVLDIRLAYGVGQIRLRLTRLHERHATLRSESLTSGIAWRQRARTIPFHTPSCFGILDYSI